MSYIVCSPFTFLHRPPLHSQRPHSREARQRRRQLESAHQRSIVHFNHSPNECRPHDGPQIGSTRRKHSLRIQLWHHSPQILQQTILKDIFRGRNEHGPTQRLRKDRARGPDGHVVERQHGLCGHKRLVHAQTAAEAEAGLVADPHGVAGIGMPGCEHAGADGDEDGRDEHEGRVVSYRGYEDAGEESGDDVGHYEGNVHDA